MIEEYLNKIIFQLNLFYFFYKYYKFFFSCMPEILKFNLIKK